ncbi:DUF6221 family protein [Streptomyces sp. NBC_01511]|uniref:DUF6221 family protein n=1 Tax=Streptomyces sp. NBC_01511 TaxID=2903889 RepID=UPI003865A99F
MDDLVHFLRAGLDHDEVVAREAPPAPWRQAPTARHHSTASGRSEEAVFGVDAVRVATTGEGRQSLVAAKHFARHDPARVLAEIDAKWRMIRVAFEHAADVDAEFGDADDFERNGCKHTSTGDLPLLRLLALPYAAHPEYQAASRP